MKKNLITFLMLILFTGSMFAASPYLYGVSRSSDCFVTQSDNAVTESYNGSDGGRYETTAKLNGSDVNFTFVARGVSDYSFTSNPNFITVYQGNYDLDNWNAVDFSIDSMTSSATPPQTKNNDNDAIVEAAEVCIVAATVCLCSIALWDMCDDDDVYYPSHRHRHYDGPTIYVDPYVGTPSSSSRTYSSNNYLYNYNSTSDYMLGFHIKANGGPDYRVRVNTGREVFDYYFLRSDRKTSNNIFLKAQDKPYNGVVVTADVNEFSTFGFNYIYSGTPVGLYLGANARIDTNYSYLDSSKIVGRTYDHDFENVEPTTFGNDVITFARDGTFIRDSFAFNIGMDFKIVDHFWLLGGVGFDFRDDYIFGNATYSNGNVDNDVCIKDSYIQLYPQIGANLILGNFDIGAMLNYFPDDENFRFDIMCGFAL